MRTHRVVEVSDCQIQKWAEQQPEYRSVSGRRWAPWDLYLDWLRSKGWAVLGVLGALGVEDHDRTVLVIVAADDPQADPQIAIA